ncbi:MAG: energy transducer TonB [Ghiorsea sp.]|nr:energy transducer TonB [Ghiorsea sp.]
MFQPRYVAPAVALCAALGVHAFILFYNYPTTILVTDKKMLEITLLPQVSLQKKEPNTAPPVKNKTVQKILATRHLNNKSSSVQEQKDIPKKRIKQDKPQIKEPQKNSANPALIPKDIQRVILTKITYPKQALRRGWEGQAKFSLEIHQHNIQHVTMLVSTGYQVLDRAARRGIASIQSLPLHDGTHLLPITFRLQ